MVVSGKNNPKQAGVEEVAERTVRVLKRTVPAAQPGVVFLSGGQSDESGDRAPERHGRDEGLPWPLTFSYSRALQNPALKTWKGQAGNVAAAQKAFHHRAHMNSLAAQGKWRARAREAGRIGGAGMTLFESSIKSLPRLGQGQGARHLRGRRRQDADRGERPPLGVRRGAARPDPGEGARAERDGELLVRAARPRGARTSSPASTRSQWFAENERDAGARPLGRGEEAQAAADRGGGARLHHRLGLEGLPEERARSAASSCPGACARPRSCREPIFTPATKAESRARREHHLRPGGAADRQGRSRRRCATSAIRLYREAADYARDARHHHRRHQVRVRPGREQASWCSSTRC